MNSRSSWSSGTVNCERPIVIGRPDGGLIMNWIMSVSPRRSSLSLTISLCFL